MDQGNEVRKLERRHKEALVGILKLIEEIVPELKLDAAKEAFMKERVQKLQFLMR